MNQDELRIGLAGRERFAPDLDAVRDRLRLATEPVPRRSATSTFRRRVMPVAASIAAVALLVVSIAVVHGRSSGSPAAPPASVVAGTWWQLTSATVTGLPNDGVKPDLTESLYLYPDGSSVATGFCFTRQGRWEQSDSDLVFTDQRTLQHPCPLQMQDDAPRRAMLQLDGPMRFTRVADTLRLDNSHTGMILTAAGKASANPWPSAPGSTDPEIRAISAITWQLTAAAEAGTPIALPPGRAILQLYRDGTSNMTAPGCFYRTGRWHTTTGGIALTDQVRPAMSCYAITDFRIVAVGEVLTAVTGTLQATLSGNTLTLRSGDVVATFTNVGGTGGDTSPAPTGSR